MNKVILLNGPASSGKTKAVGHLKKSIPLVSRECKGHLHRLTALFFNVSEERYWEVYNNRILKGTPLEDFRVCLTEGGKKKLEGYLSYVLSSTDSDRNMLIVTSLEGGTDFHVNLTIREAMIYISEVICKPRFGQDYFGRVRAESVLNNEIIIDDSTGFKSELPPLIKRVGMENILLIRVHREDYTFEGDSRDYIPDEVIDNTIDICNNTSLEDFLEEVQFQVERFLV